MQKIYKNLVNAYSSTLLDKYVAKGKFPTVNKRKLTDTSTALQVFHPYLNRKGTVYLIRNDDQSAGIQFVLFHFYQYIQHKRHKKVRSAIKILHFIFPQNQDHPTRQVHGRQNEKDRVGVQKAKYHVNCRQFTRISAQIVQISDFVKKGGDFLVQKSNKTKEKTPKLLRFNYCKEHEAKCITLCCSFKSDNLLLSQTNEEQINHL